VTYHIPQRKRNLRGTKYPIPGPKTRQANQFIVSAQQLPKQRKKQKDPDFDDPDSIFLDRTGSSQGSVLGYGKKNPNQARRKIGKKNKTKGRDM